MPLHTFIHRLVVTDRQMSTHLMFNPSYFKSVPLIQKGVFILWEEQAVFLNILEYIHSITKYYKQIHHGLGGLRPRFRSDVRVQLEHNTNAVLQVMSVTLCYYYSIHIAMNLRGSCPPLVFTNKKEKY